MTWKWEQATGTLWMDGKKISSGYSGNGRGKNNPQMQAAKGVGPIPRGKWKMVEVYNSPNTGPFTIRLEAVDGTPDDVHQATGRSAFRIHGDSIKNPGTASHGCIILPRSVRERLWRSAERVIEVIA